MGYAVDIEISDVIIPASQIAGCLDAINDLHADDMLLRHAEIVDIAAHNARQPIRVSHRYGHVENPPNGMFASLADALRAWFYNTVRDSDGSIRLTEYIGEKWGHDELLYRTIAPFVQDGGEIRVQGEDGALWRYLFRNGMIHRQKGHIDYQDE